MHDPGDSRPVWPRAWMPALALCVVSLVVATPGLLRAQVSPDGASETWVGTWACSPQLVEAAHLPPAPGFTDTTVRQVIRVSIGGSRLRLRFSNAFGKTDLALVSVRVARSAGASAIAADTDRPVTFHGRSSVEVPAGALVVSDAVDVDLPPLANLAVTLYVRGVPGEVTGHLGSRTTSYFTAGNAVAAHELASPVRVEHWYFLSGVEVLASPEAAAVVVLGDSITDGRGSTTDGQDRWPDQLARRLQASPATARVAVLNQGIGGNRLLSQGLGQNALARLDRDVLAQPGARWLIVLEGINDIGGASTAQERGERAATSDDIIFAYEQIIDRAHARGLLVYGATLMPFEGFTFMNYYTPRGEADRQRVNTWIRTSGRFDGVIDLDAATRDAVRPSRLSAAVDGGDHLHPSAAGHRIIAEAVDLALFSRAPAASPSEGPRREKSRRP